MEYHTFTEDDSSFVREIGYDKDRQVLEVRIDQGNQERVYMYEDVPTEEFHWFLAADSLGRYYNNNIKGVYTSIGR